MQYSGEDRDIIARSNRLLIQRGSFIENIATIEAKDITSTSSIVELKYMGSAEFECGSLPRSLRRMTLNKDFYTLIEFTEYKDENGNTLKGYIPTCNLEYVKKIIDRLVKSGTGLQEYCSLCDFIVKDGKQKDRSMYYKDDNFWWDIENDFFMFFEHEDKVLALMESLVNIKFGYHDGKPKAVFNPLGLRLLSKMPNNPSYHGILGNTQIRGYKYDEEKGFHYIEFAQGSRLRNVFMEAMLISKINLGQVLFSINGINFKIRAEDSLKQLITQYGVDLESEVNHSKTVEEVEIDVIWEHKTLKRLCHIIEKYTKK